MEEPIFKVTVSDGFCTYEFPLDIDGDNCINDVMKVLYNHYNLPMNEGRLVPVED
jgi:hypothetical protein